MRQSNEFLGSLSVCLIQLIQWGLPDTHEIKGGRQTAVSQQERRIVQ